MQNNQNQTQLTVYYDGLCGLCSKEIKYYQSIAPEGVFCWLDIANQPENIANEPFSLSEALMYLHVKDNLNQLHIGLDAFMQIWSHLPKWWLLAKLAKLPGIYHLMKQLYKQFAKRRFARLSHCQISLKQNQQNK